MSAAPVETLCTVRPGAAPPIDAARAAAVVRRCWELHAGPPGARIEVVLMGEDEHCALHAELLDDPSPTDVMAIPYGELDGPDAVYAELLVNVDMARRVAPEHGWTAAAECALYVAHGCLHLLGFDDQDNASRAAMRAAEAEVMRDFDG